MLCNSNIFLKKFLIFFSLFLIFGNTTSIVLATGLIEPAINGKAEIGNTIFREKKSSGDWKSISTTGEIYGPTENPPSSNQVVAYTFGNNDITIKYEAGREVQAIDLKGKKPGDITYLANIKVGSIVDTAQGNNTLNFRTDKSVITFTGKGANKQQHGFDANQNDYSSFGHIQLEGDDSSARGSASGKQVIIKADNKGSIHLPGTAVKPNFIFNNSGKHCNNALLSIKTPLVVNEWSLKGFDKIELDTKLEMIEKANINFTPPLDKMHINYKDDGAGIVLGVDATGSKTVTLNALEKPRKDDQYTIGFRSATAGGMLTVNQNGHNIGVSPQTRYKELLLDGPGGFTLSGSGGIFAKSIVIKDNGDDILLDKRIDSGAGSSLRFDGNRKLRILQDLNVESIDLGNKNTILTLEDGRTIKSNIRSEGTGMLHAKAGTVSGSIDGMKDILVSGPFTVNGNAKVQNILLDNKTSNLIVEHGKTVNSNEIKSSVVDTKLTFLGNGKIISPTIEVDEIHSNGSAGAVIELEGNITSLILQYLNASTVKVIGKVNTQTIDFADKKAILELRGAEPYEFNPVEVKRTSNSTLNIVTNITTKNIQEILKISKINLGDNSTRGELTLNMSKSDMAFPDKTIMEFVHKDSVLRIVNNNKTEHKIVTLALPLATIKTTGGFIELKSLTKNLTLKSLENINLTDKMLEKLVVKGDVTIAGGPQKLHLNNIQWIDIAKKSTFHDQGGTSILARNISVGGNSKLKEDAAHYIVEIVDDTTIPTTTELDLGSSWSVVELRNTLNTQPKVTFDARIVNAENARMIFDGATGMDLQCVSGEKAASISEVETHGIITIPGTNGFDLSGTKMLNIKGGKFTDHGGKSFRIPTINIGDASDPNPAIYELDVAQGSCCVHSQVNFAHENSVFTIHNNSNNADRTVQIDHRIMPGNDGHGILIKKSVHEGKTLTIGNELMSFGDSDYKFKEIRFCGKGKLHIKSAVHALNIQLHLPSVLLRDVNANKIDFLTDTKYEASGHITGDVDFNGHNGVLTLADDKNIKGKVCNTGGSSNGVVRFSGVNGSSTYDLGTQGNRLSLIDFANNVTVGGDAYADSMNIGAGKIATFAGTNTRAIQIPSVTVNGANLPRTMSSFSYDTGIGSNNLTLDSTGRARFNNAVLVDAQTNQGQLEFMSDVWGKQKVLGVGSATFASGKYFLLEKDFEATTIVADGAKIMVMSSNPVYRGQMKAQNFGVDLGNYSVQFAGNKKFTGTFEIDTIYDSATKQGGSIAVKPEGDNKIDLADVGQVKIKLASNTNINHIPAGGLEYKVITSTNCLIPTDISKIVLDASGEQNQSVSWTVVGIDNNSLTLKVSDDYTPIVPAVKGSEAYQFYNDLGYMTPSQQQEAWDKLSSREAKGIDTDIVPIITGIMNQVNAHIDQRAIGNNQVNNTPAIGAGDDKKLLYGLWVTPFFSNAKQKMLNGVSGYKAKSSGAIIGFDTLINDQIMLGAVYSRVETKLSHTDIKQGDKTKGATDIYALYGLYNLPNSNWFGEGVASYNTTRVKNSEGRVTSTAMETAYANYRATSYGGQLLAGYNYQVNQQVMLTPLLGGRYSRFEDLGYTEYGTSFENLTLQKRKYNKIEGIAGIRGQALYAVNKILVIPEIHGYVNYDFQGSSPIIDARLDGMEGALPTKSWKPSRTFYTIGAGFTVKHNNSEYGSTYNCNIADKYLGHQISMKFRVHF